MALIGVKGRVQTRNYEDAEEKRHFVMEIVAEKVTFLSSKRENLKDEKSE
jgi:single-strand DNA-binding protein